MVPTPRYPGHRWDLNSADSLQTSYNPWMLIHATCEIWAVPFVSLSALKFKVSELHAAVLCCASMYKCRQHALAWPPSPNVFCHEGEASFQTNSGILCQGITLQAFFLVGRICRWQTSFSLQVFLQVETGSAITWKYPSVVLKGDNTVGEFYSVALTNHYQQADTGTKMIHMGKNSRSRIISKGISAGKSRNVYRGQVQVQPTADGARNFSQCDSMLIGDQAGANTYPYIQVEFLSLNRYK